MPPVRTVKAKPLLPPALEQSLAAVEAQLDVLDTTLLGGDAVRYEAECRVLHQAMLALQGVLRSAAVEGRLISQRLGQLGKRLAQQRQNMARRAVPVDRQLDFMLPGLRGSTYSAKAGGYGAGGRGVGQYTSVRA